MNEPMKPSEKFKYLSMSNDQIRDTWISALDEIIAWCDKHDYPVIGASPLVIDALTEVAELLPLTNAAYQKTKATTTALFNLRLGVKDEKEVQ